MGSDARPGLIVFETREALAARLADAVEMALARGLAERGAASLAVSGGSTPADLYRALAARPIDWSRVTIVLVDERWVRPGEAGSNETFLNETLLRGRAAEATLVGLWSDAPAPASGLAETARRLEGAPRPFDAVILGMGGDGHTASWFPHAEGLGDALTSAAPLAAVTARRSEVTGAHTERLTLTLAAVADARLIALLVTGEEKRAAYERARAEGPVADMPVRAILDARPDLWAAWAP